MKSDGEALGNNDVLTSDTCAEAASKLIVEDGDKPLLLSEAKD